MKKFPENYTELHDMRECTIILNDGRTISGMFTEDRVADCPDGFHMYQIRHRDDDDSEMGTIEKSVIVNYFGTIFTEDEIDLGRGGFVEVEDWGFDD